MTTITLPPDVELDGEGFFVDPGRWTEEMVPALAAKEGIDELADGIGDLGIGKMAGAGELLVK